MLRAMRAGAPEGLLPARARTRQPRHKSKANESLYIAKLPNCRTAELKTKQKPNAEDAEDTEDFSSFLVRDSAPRRWNLLVAPAIRRSASGEPRTLSGRHTPRPAAAARAALPRTG